VGKDNCNGTFVHSDPVARRGGTEWIFDHADCAYCDDNVESRGDDVSILCRASRTVPLADAPADAALARQQLKQASKASTALEVSPSAW
jgi:hypothetical protein